MIKLQELNPHNYTTDKEIDNNLNILLERMNKVRALWGKPMIVTSGLRSQADQARINPSAPKSKHLLGAACDISDPDGSLGKWCLENPDKLEGLWLEHPSTTKGWTHFQIFPPKSGKKFFYP